MKRKPNPTANPRRVAAGRANQALRRGLSDAGRQRLRASAILHKPWRFSSGPKSLLGKMKSALNGKRRRKGGESTAQVDAETRDLAKAMAEMRQMLSTSLPA